MTVEDPSRYVFYRLLEAHELVTELVRDDRGVSLKRPQTSQGRSLVPGMDCGKVPHLLVHAACLWIILPRVTSIVRRVLKGRTDNTITLQWTV